MGDYVCTDELRRYVGFNNDNDPLDEQDYDDAIARAEAEVEARTNSKFLKGTLTTPAYGQVTNEKQRGKGRDDRDYFSRFSPIPPVEAEVTGTAVVASDTTIYVDSTQGFPSTGIIGIESDKITYTGKSDTSFTGCTGVDSSHGTATFVKPYVVEVSTTARGGNPTWQVLIEDQDFDMDLDTGRVHLYDTGDTIDPISSSSPPQYTPNRFRQSYIYGWDTIPNDIKRCVLMIAAKDLMYSTVRNKTIDGLNDFNPTMININEDWIDNTLSGYVRSLFVRNV